MGMNKANERLIVMPKEIAIVLAVLSIDMISLYSTAIVSIAMPLQ